MTDTAAALGSLGSDLAFSVSFGIGRELLDAAHEAQLSEDALVVVVLVLSIVLAAVPRTVKVASRELRRRAWLGKPTPKTAEGSGLASFAALLVDIARRIAISISVQLLAANVRAKQPNRAVRIVSLLSVAVFFREWTPLNTPCPNNTAPPTPPLPVSAVFLEATSSIGLKVRTE